VEKLDGKSMDTVTENIAKLKEIFPDVLSEGKVDFEALEATLGEYVEGKEERYSFNWNGKARARRIAQTPSTGTLRPAPKESKDWDTTENLYIEGDNLEVLKLLQKSYHKRVKMIYIDPPYNTGKDFVYKDNFKDNIKNYLEQTGQVDSEGNKLSTNSDTSGRYHSDWLNMMYPRLKLARNLLKDDGVIFISIDDNEVANLRKICDEIFGEDNFVAEIVWQKRTSPDARTSFSTAHEYIIVYAKDNDFMDNGFNKLPLTSAQVKQYKNPDNDPRGPWVSSDFTAQGYRPNQMYKITTPEGITYYPPEGRCWKNTENVYKEELEKGRFWFGADGKGVPRWKTYLEEVEGRVPWTWWMNSEFGHSQIGTQEVKVIFDDRIFFDYPKPTILLKQALKIGTNEDELILDFFSGSATTAHAVMQLNAEDRGDRKYILVQLPEKTDNQELPTICEIGKERIRRAGEKIVEELKGAAAEADENNATEVASPDIGFKVFKLDSSNIKAWDPDSEDLEQSLLEAVDNIKSDRTEADLLYEILLKYGLDLTLPIEELELSGKKVYVVGLGALVICLDEQITLDTVEAIAKLKEQYEADDLMRVVFRDNGFKDAEVKTNAIQILKQFGIDDVKSV